MPHTLTLEGRMVEGPLDLENRERWEDPDVLATRPFHEMAEPPPRMCIHSLQHWLDLCA